MQCPECPVKFSRKWALTCHLRIHTNECPYLCDKCDSKFKYRNSLNSHKESQHGEQKAKSKSSFKCEYCEYVSKNNSYLKIHTQQYIGEKPLSCPVCHEKFSRGFILNTHCKLKHNYSQQDLIIAGMLSQKAKPDYLKEKEKDTTFSCSICNIMYVSKGRFKRHMLSHQENVLSCEKCRKLFSKPQTLERHKRFKCHECTVCGKTFKEGNNLRSHVQRHSMSKNKE